MGYLRFLLCLTVVYCNTAKINYAGFIAVYGFFVLAGFLITMVSHEIYSNGIRGKLYFVLNRAVRLYPTYYACLLFSLMCMAYLNFSTHEYYHTYKLPQNVPAWIAQFTILGQSMFDRLKFYNNFRILPTAWSLSTEIFYYLIIGLITGRSRRLTCAAFIVSVLMTAYLWFAGYEYMDFYTRIHGSGAIFFLGGLLYHYRHALRKAVTSSISTIVILIGAALYVPDLFNFPRKEITVLWGSSLIIGYCILCLYLRACVPFKKLEQWCADISYPIFLIHMPVAAVISYAWLGIYQRSVLMFFVSLPFIIGISWAILVLIERPTVKWRTFYRLKAMGKG